MSTPKDYSSGLKKFFEFHQLEPTKAGQFSGLRIPNRIAKAGSASWVAYASNKWSGKRTNYIHDHEAGVKTCRPDIKGDLLDIPSSLRNTKTLVKLGDCLGFGYNDGEGDVEAKVSKPYPELYCTPDGSVLLVIQNKRKLIAIIWGGLLDVKARGIVG